MTTPIAPGVWTQRKNLFGILALTLFIGTLPLWLNTPYALSTMVLIGIYTIVTIGLCLLMGYAGQVSLGQAAFFGLGASGAPVDVEVSFLGGTAVRLRGVDVDQLVTVIEPR